MSAAPAIIEHDAHEPARAGIITPMVMLDRALSSGAGIETLTKLMDLQERYEANEARKAFDKAIAEAKAEIPVIRKNRAVGYDAKNGSSRTSYRHEDMAEIARTIDPILSKHGLSYRYRSQQEGNVVRVTCIISHRDGHAEEVMLTAGNDTTGNKNSIQAVGSTITYLQRYTLKAALGLAASADDDGKSSENTPEDDRSVTEDQVKELRALIEETQSDIAKICRYWKVEALPDIPASKFNDVMQSIRGSAKNREQA